MENLTQLPISCVEVRMDSSNSEGFSKASLQHDWGTMSIILCDAGRMKVNVNDQEIVIEKGDMLFVNAFMFMHVMDVSYDFHGHVMVAKSSVMFPIVKSILDVNSQLYFRKHPLMHLDPNRYGEMESISKHLERRILYEKTSSLKGPKWMVAHEFTMLIFRALVLKALDVCLENAMPSSSYNDRSDAFVYQFIVEVFNNYREHREVMFYAATMCVSPSYLSTVVKQKTGKPALQWIIDLVINEAKQELRYTNKSIKEISVNLSFSTQSFFGKYFKKYAGMSPKAYREKFKFS